jgi:hypothetical protein
VIDLPVPVVRRAPPPGRRFGWVLVLCGLVLVPWLVVLATGGAPQWTVAWIGLDALEAVGLITSGVLAMRGHRALTAAAAATATLLVVDAWFDISTSHGSALAVALVMALVAELPVAAACTVLALRALPRPRAERRTG